MGVDEGIIHVEEIPADDVAAAAERKRVLEEFRAGLAGQLDEDTLQETVNEFQVTSGIGIAGGTTLTVAISNGVLAGTTAGGKTFTGQNAKGSGNSFGHLDKTSTTLYTDTTNYVFTPGKRLDTIVFKNAAGKKLGTWRGAKVGVKEPFSGPGRWTV